MTVSSAVSRSGPYTFNGATTVFDYDFKVYDEAHLRVVVVIDGTESDLVLGSDYTVSGVGTNSGHITTLETYDSGTLTIVPDVPFTQETDLENQGAYYAETVERSFDLSVMRDLQLRDGIDRSIKMPSSESVGDGFVVPDAAERAGKVIGFDTDGVLTMLPGSGSGGDSAPAILQLATGELPLSAFGPFTGTSHSAAIQRAFDEASSTKRPLLGTYRPGGYYLDEPVYLRSDLTLNNVPGNVFRRAYYHPNIMEGAFCTYPNYDNDTEVFINITLNDLWFNDIDNDRRGSFLTLKCDNLKIRGFRGYKLSGGCVTHFLGNNIELIDTRIDSYNASTAEHDPPLPFGSQIWSDCIHFSFCSNVRVDGYWLRAQDDGIGFTHDPPWGNMLPKRNPISQNIQVLNGFVQSKIAHGVRFGGEQLTLYPPAVEEEITYLIDPDVAYQNILVDNLVVYGIPDPDGTPRYGAAVTLHDSRDNATAKNTDIVISNVRARNTVSSTFVDPPDPDGGGPEPDPAGFWYSGPECVSIKGYLDGSPTKTARNFGRVKLQNLNVTANENGAGQLGVVFGVEELEISDCRFGDEYTADKIYNGMTIIDCDKVTIRDSRIEQRGDSGFYPLAVGTFDELTLIDTTVVGGGVDTSACIYLDPKPGSVSRLEIDGLDLRDAAAPIVMTGNPFLAGGVKARGIRMRGLVSNTLPAQIALAHNQSGGDWATGVVGVSGGTPTVTFSNNVTSVSRTSVGIFVITMTQAALSAVYPVTVSVGGSAIRTSRVTVRTTTQITIVFETIGGSQSDPDEFSFRVWQPL